MLNEHQSQTAAGIVGQAENVECETAGSPAAATAEVRSGGAEPRYTRRAGDEPASLAEYIADISITRDACVGLCGAECTLDVQPTE